MCVASPLLHLSLIRFQIYEQMPNEKGTVVYSIQKKFQAVMGFTFPIFHGRGLLNCTLVYNSTGDGW